METKQVNNYGLKGVLFIFILLFGVMSSNANIATDSYSSLVIIKINGLNGDSYNKIAAEINKEPSLSLEYSCLESDIIVIKYRHTFNEKGDVQHFINNRLKRWIGKTKIEFIHVDLTLGGSSKC